MGDIYERLADLHNDLDATIADGVEPAIVAHALKRLIAEVDLIARDIERLYRATDRP
jgi:hypothetical protein